MNTFSNNETGTAFLDQQDHSNPDKIILLNDPYRRMVIPEISDKAIDKMWDRHSPLFESNFQTIYNFLGEPEYIRNHNLGEEQMKVELDRLRELLAEKKIVLRNFTKVPSAELYRFITRELFNMLTSGRILTDTHELVYEEFHGNDEYDIRKNASVFFKGLLESNWGIPSIKVWKHTLVNYKLLKEWMRSYADFDDVKIEMEEIEFLENSAILTYNASFIAIHTDHFFVTKYEGGGICSFKKIDDRWLLTAVTLPGENGSETASKICAETKALTMDAHHDFPFL